MLRSSLLASCLTRNSSTAGRAQSTLIRVAFPVIQRRLCSVAGVTAQPYYRHFAMRRVSAAGGARFASLGLPVASCGMRATGSQSQSGPQEGATGAEQRQTPGEESKKSEGANNDGKAKTEKKDEPQLSFIQALRQDFKTFPDIYNAPNMLNFVLFTVFCLCSTGSNVELEWWMEHWGVDAAFRPWAWFLHSLLMNNFLSMTFAMMLTHTMCHSVAQAGLGNAGLMKYLAIISVASGFLMWCYNAATNNRREKQFGPWDCIAGLFVMQYLHQGFTPFSILNSFNGWVKYACFVGAACILYFDWQPTVLGAGLGYVLCKTRFKAPIVAAK